jgi:hypothetical protein
MVIVANRQGTTTEIISSPIYQGSSLVNELVFLAPFSSTNSVTVTFTLPNGVQLDPILMASVPISQLGITDEDRHGYNAWVLLVDVNATEWAGALSLYFSVNTGAVNGNASYLSSYLSSYQTTIEVTPGGAPNLPESPTNDVYQQIITALSKLQADTTEAIDKSISYIRYTAPQKYLLNAPTSEGVTVETSPSDIPLNGLAKFDLEGMTEYLDESNIIDPAGVTFGNQDNANKLFFQPSIDTGSNPVGFIVDLGELKQIGLVQMYAWNIHENITVKLYLSTDNVAYTLSDSITLPKTDASVLDIFQLNGKSTNARYIKVVQEDTIYTFGVYSVKGVEIFEANNEGKYLIKRINGNVSYVDSVDGISLVNKVRALTTEAEGYAESAGKSADDAQNKYNEINNELGSKIAPLGEDGLIPNQYLPPLVITDYIKVNSVADLTSTVAQKGDIAYIETTVDGVTTTQFYILTDNDYTESKNWLEYNPSVAGSALYADKAKVAENSQKVGGMTFEGILTQAQYQEKVTNGTIVNGTIYIVEV